MATVALPAASSGSTPTVHVAREPLAECSTVLLATARVWVVDRAGARHAVRALVDPGSETSLIAESLAQRLVATRRDYCDRAERTVFIGSRFVGVAGALGV